MKSYERAGRASVPALERAQAELRRAIAIDGEIAEAFAAWARASLRLAAAQPGRARTHVSDGLTHVDKALALNPRFADAHAVRSALLLRRAHAATDETARAQDLAAARAEAGRAFELNPLLKGEWGEVLREADRDR
jgi:hypothetical protein